MKKKNQTKVTNLRYVDNTAYSVHLPSVELSLNVRKHVRSDTTLSSMLLVGIAPAVLLSTISGIATAKLMRKMKKY